MTLKTKRELAKKQTIKILNSLPENELDKFLNDINLLQKVARKWKR